MVSFLSTMGYSNLALSGPLLHLLSAYRGFRFAHPRLGYNHRSAILHGKKFSCPFVLLSFIFLFFRKDFLYGLELPNDILCTSRSDDNRRGAGAVGSSAFGIHYNQTNLHLIDGPAARHFGLFSVFCGLFISVHSRPFVVPYQSFWLRLGRSMNIS